MSTETETDHLAAQQEVVEGLQTAAAKIKEELSHVIIGQEEVIDELLIAFFAGGNCLLTGAPGLAKTLLVKSLASLLDLDFQRIQFTPDLMPADITGTEILEETEEGRQMTFVHGPVFTNVLLADEINRTPPKTQAALLEAMQEKQVTAAGKLYELDKPFFVLATQNPIEMEGTYPLPEAQLDRFMFNIEVDYLPEDDEVAVVLQTTSANVTELPSLYSAEDVAKFQEVIRTVPIAESVARYAVQLVQASRPGTEQADDFINQYVEWGAGLRAAQFLALGGKARALMNQRAHVTLDDIKTLAYSTLRHRLLINYQAEAEGLSVENVIEHLIESTPVPTDV